MRERRTQLAPADDARFAGAARAARRGDGVQCDRWDLVSSFVGSGFVCGPCAGGAAPQIEQQGKLGQFAALKPRRRRPNRSGHVLPKAEVLSGSG